MAYAERNREIKKVVEQAFGKGKVAVKGSRGTAYGWVTVRIDYATRNWRESSELRMKVHQLIKAAGIELSTYYGDMDNEPRSCIHIEFDRRQEEGAYPA